MRIALIDSTPRAKLYPLPLLKLGAWRKAEGDTCELFRDRLPEAGAFDEIWVSTCFTFDIPHALGLVKEAKARAPVVKVGGIAATLLPEHFEKLDVLVHRGLIAEAEKFAPDYSLLPEPPEYSISHTSRGCTRKCGFCMVSRLEPNFEHRPGWDGDLDSRTKKILFYDNNWLAKPRDWIDEDVKTLRKLILAGKLREIDFNQGLDARLMTENLADLLKGLPLRPVRFAFDGMHEDGYYQRAIDMMASRGFHEFMTYVLYNFKDTPADLYYRLRVSVELGAKYRIAVKSFPMKFQPVLEVRSKGYVGTAWTKKELSAMRIMITGHSPNQTVSCCSHNKVGGLAEFEYCFGRTAEDFLKLLNYPRIRELVQKRKGALRERRRRMGSSNERGAT